MVMQNKKGLSDVITNVLIILLVLIAIGIIASFVIPLVRNAGTQVQSAQDCLNIRVSAVSCKYVANSAGTGGVALGYNISYSIRRDVGAGNIKDVKLIFEKQDGSTDLRNLDNVGSFVEFATISNNVSNSVYNPKSLSVAVIINGSSSACSETAKIACSFA